MTGATGLEQRREGMTGAADWVGGVQGEGPGGRG